MFLETTRGDLMQEVWFRYKAPWHSSFFSASSLSGPGFRTTARLTSPAMGNGPPISHHSHGMGPATSQLTSPSFTPTPWRRVEPSGQRQPS